LFSEHYQFPTALSLDFLFLISSLIRLLFVFFQPANDLPYRFQWISVH